MAKYKVMDADEYIKSREHPPVKHESFRYRPIRICDIKPYEKSIDTVAGIIKSRFKAGKTEVTIQGVARSNKVDAKKAKAAIEMAIEDCMYDHPSIKIIKTRDGWLGVKREQ